MSEPLIDTTRIKGEYPCVRIGKTYREHKLECVSVAGSCMVTIHWKDGFNTTAGPFQGSEEAFEAAKERVDEKLKEQPSLLAKEASEPPSKRGYRILSMTPEFFLHPERFRLAVPTKDALPEDAEVLNARHEFTTNCVEFLIGSTEFSPTPPGLQMLAIEPQFTTVCCDTCHHWSEGFRYEGMSRGICKLFQGRKDDPSGAVAISKEMGGPIGIITTSADFGCVQWKAKEPA